MRLAGSPAVLLAGVTSLLFWPLLQATTIIYRGCAFRAVAGKERALWFCLADNLCAMFHCRDNTIFSLHDCGCVSPHQTRDNHILQNNTGNNTGGGSGVGGTVVSVTMTTPRPTSTSSSPLSLSSPSPSHSVVLSGAGSNIQASPTPQPGVTVPGCQREIHIDGLVARGTGSDTGGQRTVRIVPRGVIDLGNGSTFYDGYSYLSVPMYSDASFQAGFTVDFLLQEGTSTLRQVLMTNCKHGQGPSVEIVLDVELGVILFHVMYRFRDATNAVESVVEVAVPYTPFVQKRVALVFDGQTLTGRVNNNNRSAHVQGTGDYVLASRSKPLMFGNTLCDVDDVYSYRGQIKYISIYRCAKNVTELFS